jgi:putative DNA primase/helicase
MNVRSPMTLSELAQRLNGTVNGRWINIPGPHHRASDRSLGVHFDPAASEGFVVNSLAGDAQTECRAHVRALLQKLNNELTVSYEPEQADCERLRSSFAYAMKLWEQSKSPKNTLVETYLHNRRCKLSLSVGTDIIRFHPTCPFGSFQVPAMLGLITDALTGDPIGVHRTAIKDDGSGKRVLGEGISSKMVLGRARGGVIRLRAFAEHLGIAEGIETALSASQVFGTAVWASLSKVGVAKFPVLKGVKRLTVFADHDAPGVQAAEQCCRRYQSAGINAELRHPGKPGSDWNDFVMEENV